MNVLNFGNDHVFAYVRTAPLEADGQEAGQGPQRVLVIANFTESTQALPANEVRLYGLDYRFRELISGKEITLGNDPLVLEPYAVLWLANAR